MVELATRSMRVEEREAFDGYSDFESVRCDAQQRARISRLDDGDDLNRRFKKARSSGRLLPCSRISALVAVDFSCIRQAVCNSGAAFHRGDLLFQGS